jgi:hypothetical protein
MKEFRFACAAAVALVAIPSPAAAVPDFCYNYAVQACTEGENLGYPDFASCGRALYEQCLTDNGYGGGSGSTPVYVPPFPSPPVCTPTGRIDARPC